MDFFLKIKVSKKEEQKNKDMLDGLINLQIRMKQIENTWHKRQHTKRKGVFDKGCQHEDKKSQMR